MSGAVIASLLLGALAGALVGLAQINLHRSRKMLRDADQIRKAAHAEFERWRKASEALELERAELHRECERYRLAASSIEQECVIRFGRNNGKPR